MDEAVGGDADNFGDGDGVTRADHEPPAYGDDRWVGDSWGDELGVQANGDVV